MQRAKPPIEIVGDESIVSFLERNLCLFLNPQHPEWERNVLAQSPVLGPYLISGVRNKVSVDIDLIRLDIPDTRPAGSGILHCPWDAVLSSISVPIAIVCAAGASKAFIDLLRTWVEERKGRRIKIKRGDIEVEIQGGVSAKDIERVTEIFEEQFGKSRILEP
jgi:hypothetical protein